MRTDRELMTARVEDMSREEILHLIWLAVKDTEKVLVGLVEGMRSDMKVYWEDNNEEGTCSACLAGLFLGLRVGAENIGSGEYSSVMDFLNRVRLPWFSMPTDGPDVNSILSKLDIVTPECPEEYSVNNSHDVVRMLNELLMLNSYYGPVVTPVFASQRVSVGV
jgi:hypothetical protein